MYVFRPLCKFRLRPCSTGWNKKSCLGGNYAVSLSGIGTVVTGTVVYLFANTILLVYQSFGLAIISVVRLLHNSSINLFWSISMMAYSSPKIFIPTKTFVLSLSTICSWCVILAQAYLLSVPSIKSVITAYLLHWWVCALILQIMISTLHCLILIFSALIRKNALSISNIVQLIFLHKSSSSLFCISCAQKVVKCHN